MNQKKSLKEILSSYLSEKDSSKDPREMKKALDEMKKAKKSYDNIMQVQQTLVKTYEELISK